MQEKQGLIQQCIRVIVTIFIRESVCRKHKTEEDRYYIVRDKYRKACEDSLYSSI